MSGRLANWAGRAVWPLQALRHAQGQLFGWVPVFIAVGIAIWFALPFEPGIVFYGVALLALALSGIARLYGPELGFPVAITVGCIALGLLACGIRAHSVAAPMLEFRYYGPVQGRIIEIDRSQTDALRITLDGVVLEDVAPQRTPAKVRISLGKQPLTPVPGQVVLLTAFLSAPEGPSEPGGFDFRRMAFFNRLGAVGYTRSPVMLWESPQDGTQVINRLRTRLSAAIMARIPGDAGAFASGVMTGDRSGISLDTVQALRDSSLAHLLAISGMNMAFVTGFVFMLVRYGVATVPPLALRLNTKKLAAVVAFGVALFYLLLSGANVATTRAFLMVCVMLGAILLDRRALTLRSVAVAGVILMLTKPETLLEPGFQMSFAATIALIAGFAALDASIYRQKMPRWMIPVFTLVLSSVIAGFATAPYAAAHFNRFTDYGLLANLLTVPIMGTVIMPAGAVAALLAPVGLEALPLWVMEQGARWILFVAHWIASLDGAVTAIPAPGPWVMPLMTLGAIWVILWQGWIRGVGLVPVALAFGLWLLAERPVLLVSGDGKLLGLIGAEGRALSAARGGGFAAENWLENDGDLAAQVEAAERPGFTGAKGESWFKIGGSRAVSLTGKGAMAALGPACATGALVILAERATAVPEGCRLVDGNILAATGALAVWHDGAGLRVERTHWATRLWSPPHRPVDLPAFVPPLASLAAGQ